MGARSRTEYDLGPQQHRSSRVASVLRPSRLHQIQNAARLSEAFAGYVMRDPGYAIRISHISHPASRTPLPSVAQNFFGDSQRNTFASSSQTAKTRALTTEFSWKKPPPTIERPCCSLLLSPLHS